MRTHALYSILFSLKSLELFDIQIELVSLRRISHIFFFFKKKIILFSFSRSLFSFIFYEDANRLKTDRAKKRKNSNSVERSSEYNTMYMCIYLDCCIESFFILYFDFALVFFFSSLLFFKYFPTFLACRSCVCLCSLPFAFNSLQIFSRKHSLWLRHFFFLSVSYFVSFFSKNKKKK